MMNLTGSISIDLAKVPPIDFSHEVSLSLPKEAQQLLSNLARDSKIIYDWGSDEFYSSSVPYTIDHENGKILPEDKSKWIGCTSDQLKDWTRLQGTVFLPGETIGVLLKSGIEVDLINTKEYGPEDPAEYIKCLKSQVDS